MTRFRGEGSAKDDQIRVDGWMDGWVVVADHSKAGEEVHSQRRQEEVNLGPHFNVALSHHFIHMTKSSNWIGHSN